MQRFNILKIPLALQIVLVTFLLNMAAETTNIFIVLYANDLGSSKIQIGIILGVNSLAFFLTSLIMGRQSDIHGRVKFIRLGLGLLIASYILHIFATGAWTLLLIRCFQGLCMGVVSAALTAYTYEFQAQIGRYVSFGSLGVLFGDITAAIVQNYHAIFITSTVISVVALLFSLRLTENKNRKMTSVALPLPLLKANWRVYLSFFLRQTGASGVFAVLPLLLASIGASRTWIALINGTNMLTQFIAMRFVERINPVKAFRIGLLLGAVVFAIYGTLRVYQFFIPVQILLGITWSLLYIGVLVYLMRRNPERGSVSGLLFSTQNIAWSIGSFAAGGIAQVLGYSAVMFVGAGMSLVAALTSRGMKPDIKPPKSA
jgi:MFS family permease